LRLIWLHPQCKIVKKQKLKKYQVKSLMGHKTMQRNKANRISLMPLSAFLYLTMHAHNAGYRGGEESACGLSRTIHIHITREPRGLCHSVETENWSKCVQSSNRLTIRLRFVIQVWPELALSFHSLQVSFCLLLMDSTCDLRFPWYFLLWFYISVLSSPSP